MRYQPNKAFPHPVLRPVDDDSDAGDFPDFDFQTSVSIALDEEAGQIRLETEFEVQQSDIVRAVRDGQAVYSLLVVCPTTFYRSHFTSETPVLETRIEFGDVEQQVELRPSVVAVCPISDYRPADLHPELVGRAFRLDLGGVLAQDYSSHFPAGREFLQPITSIFQMLPDPKQPSGQLDIIVGDPVQIRINNKDNAQRLAAKRTARGRASLMSSVYLPAVMNLLAEAVRLNEDASDSRWFKGVQYRLADVGIDFDELCDGRATLWHAAQAILKFPTQFAEFLNLEDDN